MCFGMGFFVAFLAAFAVTPWRLFVREWSVAILFGVGFLGGFAGLIGSSIFIGRSRRLGTTVLSWTAFGTFAGFFLAAFLARCGLVSWGPHSTVLIMMGSVA
jgi:hypothetical protein